jgi:hypothetical protein
VLFDHHAASLALTRQQLFYLKKKAILSRFSSFPSPAPFRSPSMPMKPI